MLILDKLALSEFFNFFVLAMQDSNIKPLVLLNLDGWGIHEQYNGNAVYLANTPNFDRYISSYPAWALNQDQNVSRDKSTIPSNESINKVINKTIKNSSRLNIITLLSESRSEVNIDYFKKLLEYCGKKGCETLLHLVLDGENCGGESGASLLRDILDYSNQFNNISILTVSGRFYAMDDNNFNERTEKAFNAIVKCEGKLTDSFEESIRSAYASKIFDNEFTPSVDRKKAELNYKIRSKDGVILLNHKARNFRQLALMMEVKIFRNINNPENPSIVNFAKFEREPIITSTTMQDDETLELSKIIYNNGLRQVDIVDGLGLLSHNNYGQDRLVVKSPNNTDDSTNSITTKVKEVLKLNQYHFINVVFSSISYATNTTNLKLASDSIERIDASLDSIIEQVLEKDGIVIITSSYGRAEEMVDLINGQKKSGVSSNPVPFVLIGNNYEGKSIHRFETPSSDLSLLKSTYSIGSVTPTILDILSISRPLFIKHKSLISFSL